MGDVRGNQTMKLMVAVDFGTTFSSMAFALSTKHRRQELVKHWGTGVMTGDAVPTLLKYDLGVAPGSVPYKWGFQVTADEGAPGIEYEWFKLSLYKPSSYSDSELARKYPSKTPPINEAQCRRLVVDYLRALKNNFENFKQMKPVAFRNVPTQYIITVPAIWSDAAKETTKRCAIEAGMGHGNGDIHIIKEPEAAGIYALDNRSDIDLNVDDTFVLCDAGGGTVDLISYTVSSLDPVPSLIEAAEGSGGLCGGTFLNRSFEAYLDQRFKNTRGFDAGLKRDILNRFENDYKQTFDGDINRVYTFRAQGLPDASRGYLEVPGREIERIFKEVVDKIIELVFAQIRATRRTVKAVLLAGGFGSSDYLRIKLEEALRASDDQAYRSISVQPVEEGNTAIVRGALLMGLTHVDKSLPYARPEGRIPTRSYGVPQYVDFDQRKGHDPLKKEWDNSKRNWQIQVMEWFIVQGHLVKESEKPMVKLCSEKDPYDSFNETIVPVYSHQGGPGQKPPDYLDSSLERHGELVPKLNLISQHNIRRVNGRDVADYEIEVNLDSANLVTCTLIQDGLGRGEERVEFRLNESRT